MSEEGLKDDEEKLEAAHVWARDGEGPHALAVPSSAPVEQPVAPQAARVVPETKKISAVDGDLHDLVVMAGTAQSAAEASKRADIELQSASNLAEVDDHGTQTDEVEPQADEVVSQADEAESESDKAEPQASEEGPHAEPVPAGPPSKDEIAVGYIIPLILYFVFYLVNVFASGYCLSSDKMNALGDICFYWTPALCALCLLFGSKWVKVGGAVLIVPLSIAAIMGGQYYHAYERFQTEISPWGSLVDAHHANGWRICRYESSWVNGYMPGTTYTREKDVAPYVRYVKKMRMGEPP